MAGPGLAQSTLEAGIRYGDDFSIDATFPLSKAPRLHTAFYVEGDFALGTYFDWLFALDGGPKGLRFFPGIGPEFYFGEEFDLAIAGDIGVEYLFDFPITIGIDWRPRLSITDDFRYYSGNWGITARFRFVKA
ncbi:MAG: hypothetical protein HC819_06595 [Cyclobacteriaceae bacterium]|nr:hypothetical protein [Cyclobacteriaceae bacterium]